MEPPRRYLVLAFMPVALALVTLVVLYTYQQGEEQRRESRQRPEHVLDALAIRAGMRVGQWQPADSFFLERLARRVGPEGKVYAILPRAGLVQTMTPSLPQLGIAPEPPEGLDALLILRIRAADQDLDELTDILRRSHGRLRVGGRVGVIGVGSERITGFIRADEAIAAAQTVGFSFVGKTERIKPQFLVVVEK